MPSGKRTAPARKAPPVPDHTVRERLLLAAIELFNQKGYAATSVHEIVDAAGVTKPVLYYYFKNKEGIFLELVKDGADRFLDLVARSREETAGTVRERLTRLCEGAMAICFDHLPLVRIMNAIYYGPHQGAPAFDFDTFHERFHDAVHDLLKEGIARKEFARGNLPAMTMAVTGAVSISMELNLCHPHRAPGPDVVTPVLDVIFRGLIPRHKS